MRFLQDWLKCFEGVGCKFVLFVDNRFKVFEFGKSLEDTGELVTIDAAIVKENSVYSSLVKKSTRTS